MFESLGDWLRVHDPGYGALRRAGRAAIVMPALFALGDKVIGNPTMSYFIAFGVVREAAAGRLPGLAYWTACGHRR